MSQGLSQQPPGRGHAIEYIEISDSDTDDEIEFFEDALSQQTIRQPALKREIQVQQRQPPIVGPQIGGVNGAPAAALPKPGMPVNVPWAAPVAHEEQPVRARHPAPTPATPSPPHLAIEDDPDFNWADWTDDDSGVEINRMLMEAYESHNQPVRGNTITNSSTNDVAPGRRTFEAPEPAAQPAITTKAMCIDAVVVVFPEICKEHVSSLYDSGSSSSDQLIALILDKMDKGSPYPKAKDVQKSLKRKRVLNEEEEHRLKYEAPGRIIGPTALHARQHIRIFLSYDFPESPMAFIDATLKTCGHRLFSAYRVLEECDRTFNHANPPYNKIKSQRRMPVELQNHNIDTYIANQENRDPEKVEVLRELQAARMVRKRADDRRRIEREAQEAEEENERRAVAEGTMSECGCCFSDYPLNRMIHCNSDNALHWFCRDCARQMAETTIGNSKYELQCMSTDGCAAGFSLAQRNQFLSEATIVALERNEAEAMLRMAGIENLASCPFCPYAAEYPPVEENREFKCQAPDCEKVSCRLCKKESHIPKSCEEHARENGLSVRRQIEEAMSAALIRKCNKCGTPFVKEEGCNKMTCTRGGCRNIQCYVCSKSCDYSHFNDERRGGKHGNCPLFEDVQERHNTEVQKAEKEALARVHAEHPEYTEEELKVKMSENVHKDDERRKARLPQLGMPADVLQYANRVNAGYYDGRQHGPIPAGDPMDINDNFDDFLFPLWENLVPALNPPIVLPDPGHQVPDLRNVPRAYNLLENIPPGQPANLRENPVLPNLAGGNGQPHAQKRSFQAVLNRLNPRARARHHPRLEAQAQHQQRQGQFAAYQQRLRQHNHLYLQYPQPNQPGFAVVPPPPQQAAQPKNVMNVMNNGIDGPFPWGQAGELENLRRDLHHALPLPVRAAGPLNPGRPVVPPAAAGAGAGINEFERIQNQLSQLQAPRDFNLRTQGMIMEGRQYLPAVQGRLAGGINRGLPGQITAAQVLEARVLEARRLVQRPPK